MILGNQCAECGGPDAGARQLCAKCEPLYPMNDNRPAAALVDDVCPCIACRSDMAGLVPCMATGRARA